MEPIDYTGALRRSWRLLLALALVGAVIAVLLPVSKPAKALKTLPWQASALVGSIPTGKGSPLVGGVTSSQIYFYATSNTVERGTMQALHPSVYPYEYFRYLTATLVAPGTTSLKQTTESTTPLKRNSATEVLLTGYGSTETAAIALANYYAYELNYVIEQAAQARAASVAAAAAAAAAAKSNSSNSSSDTGSSGSPGPVSTGFVLQQPAEFATRSAASTNITSSRKVRLLAGLVIGALVGAGIVLLRELLDKRLRTAARAESNFGFPVVVEIPALPVKAGQSAGSQPIPVDVVREPESPGAEAYRMLRMSVLFEGLAPQSAPTDPFGYEYGQGVLLDRAPGRGRPCRWPWRATGRW